MIIAALVLAALATATPTPLEEDIDFQEGRRLVDELDYERAVFRFQKLTKSDRSVEQRAAAWAWLGLTYANLGDEGEAIQAFVSSIKLDPLVTLPPSPPKIIQLFEKARQQARAELRVDSDNDAPAAPEGPPALLIGGGVIGGLGAVGLVAGVGFGLLAASTHDEALNAIFQDDRESLARSANGLATGANVAYVAGGVLVTTGVVLSLLAMIGGAQ